MNVLKEGMDANISVLILTEVIAVNVSPVTQKAAKNVYCNNAGLMEHVIRTVP